MNKVTYIRRGICKGWMMQETSRKQTEPAYTNSSLQEDAKLNGKVM
jgi:hypothetical protein